MARGPQIDMPQGFSSRAARRGIRNTAQGWYRIADAADGAKDIFIYGEIVDEFEAELFGIGVSAAGFVRDLQELRGQALNVHINSPGGLVWDGIAVYNAIRQHDAFVRTINDGLAASIASAIMMAGDERILAPHSMLMIHDAFGLTVGNAADHEKMAERLDKMSDDIAAVYADRADKRVNWRAKMKVETWFSDTEAVAAGLADRVDTKISNKFDLIRNTVDLSVFREVPALLKGPLNLADGIPDGGGNDDPPDESLSGQSDDPEDTTLTIRDAERFLREGGFTHTEAKVIASKGWSGRAEREAQSPESTEKVEEQPESEIAALYAQYRELRALYVSGE